MRACLLSMVLVVAATCPVDSCAEPCMVLASTKASYMADGAKRSGKRLVENCDSVAAVDEELSVCFVTKQRDRACPKLRPDRSSRTSPATRSPARGCRRRCARLPRWSPALRRWSAWPA